jgi:hypothetical protein
MCMFISYVKLNMFSISARNHHVSVVFGMDVPCFNIVYKEKLFS